ncbi:MAG: VOC family protein [Actinomycetota bacterium]
MTDRSTSDARVEWLSIAGSAAAWRDLGLTGSDGPDESFSIPLMGTGLRVGAPVAGESGIVGWALSGVERPTGDTVDGLTTDVVDARPPVFAQHALGAIELDHVVVLTDDLTRTTDAVADATGCELRRVREVGTMRQGFHRIGRSGLVVEVVARPEVPAGPATFWGLVLTVEDLDAACDLLGPDRVSAPKDAVQPGRRIATLREAAGLGLPVALMTS